MNIKKIVLRAAPYVCIALYATKIGQAWRLAAGTAFAEKVLHWSDGFMQAFASPLPSFYPQDVLVGIAIAAAFYAAVYVKGKNAKKFRHNVEYGSARWGTAKDIEPYVDPTFANNIILTQTERLTMNSRPKDPRTARNKNVLVVGGSGSGKTRFFVKPNLMQCVSEKYPCSFVVTDPKGSLIVECGRMLRHFGYRIKVMNTINFAKSMLIVQDQVWNRGTINRAQKKSTRYYMDEFHLLLKEPQTAAYSVEIWKRFRKWGGIPTAITQNLKDLLASAEIENIFENSDFILMLNQAPGDREILAKKLGISARQLSYVKQSGAGEGLLLYGDTILPFMDRFPQNTELYRLMTTRLNETAGQEEENG